jgi:hypothetical protein
MIPRLSPGASPRLEPRPGRHRARAMTGALTPPLGTRSIASIRLRAFNETLHRGLPENLLLAEQLRTPHLIIAGTLLWSAPLDLRFRMSLRAFALPHI